MSMSLQNFYHTYFFMIFYDYRFLGICVCGWRSENTFQEWLLSGSHLPSRGFCRSNSSPWCGWQVFLFPEAKHQAPGFLQCSSVHEINMVWRWHVSMIFLVFTWTPIHMELALPALAPSTSRSEGVALYQARTQTYTSCFLSVRISRGVGPVRIGSLLMTEL